MTGTRILVVDDEPDIAEALAEALRLDGYSVRSCGQGDEALNLALAAPPDLILLDVRMPGPGADGLDGLRIARRLAGDERTRAVPRLLITALGPHERVPWSERLAGCGDGILFKPFELTELLETVAALLAGRRRADG